MVILPVIWQFHRFRRLHTGNQQTTSQSSARNLRSPCRVGLKKTLNLRPYLFLCRNHWFLDSPSPNSNSWTRNMVDICITMVDNYVFFNGLTMVEKTIWYNSVHLSWEFLGLQAVESPIPMYLVAWVLDRFLQMRGLWSRRQQSRTENWMMWSVIPRNIPLPSGYVKIAIENDPVEIVDFPIKNGDLDLSIVM